MSEKELQQKYEILILEIISCDPKNFDGIFYKIVDLKCKEFEQLQQENQQLKENNMSMQEEMVRTWEKADLYKEVIEEVKEVIRDSHVEVLKYHDEPSETTSYEIVTVELLQILDKVKEKQ